MKGWKETLKKYRLSIWLCVLSYPVFLVIQYLLYLLHHFIVSLFTVFPFSENGLLVWIMGLFFFTAFIFALDTFAKEMKE